MRVLSHTQNIEVDVTDLPYADVGGITVDQVVITYYRTNGRWKATSPVLVHGKNKIGDIDRVWVTEDWPDWLRDVARWCLPQDRAF